MIGAAHSPVEAWPAYDTSFDVGLEFNDDEFMAAACGAIADIVALHNVAAEEGGLSNQDIFGRLQAIFDITSERFSADLARNVEAQMSVMSAIGHAACGNEELMGGFVEMGLINGRTTEEHKDHPKGLHHHEDDDEDEED